VDRITRQGLAMPKLGLGTWPMAGAACVAAVAAALELGYRHLDTAQMYGNEAEVGAGIAASGVPRGELHVTTKVWSQDLAPGRMRAALEASLRRLRTDYVDLFMIHWPVAGMDLAAALASLVALREAGKARAIGLGNFPSVLLRRAIDELGAPIACCQFEYHVLLRQPALLDFLRGRGVPIVAYSPLAKGTLSEDRTLMAIGRKHGVTATQVGLAWLLEQQDVAAIPKSVQPARQRENLEALAVRLDAADRARIDALPKDRRMVNPSFHPAWDATG
jgi:2,5-diketo-D-gluconate reductase B